MTDDERRAAEAAAVRKVLAIITDHVESVLNDPSGLGWHVLIDDVDQSYADMRKSLLRYAKIATRVETEDQT